MVKVMLLILFILNAATFVWTKSLCSDDNIQRQLMSQDASTPAAQEMQVRVGRTYMEAYAAHHRVVRATSLLTMLNLACILFLTVREHVLSRQSPAVSRDNSGGPALRQEKSIG